VTIDTDVLLFAARGVLPPVVVVGLLPGLVQRPWRRPGERPPGHAWLTPLALGLGFSGAYVALQDWPPLRWSLSLSQWLGWAGLVLGLLGALVARFPRLRPLAALLLAGAAPRVLLGFMLEHHWEGVERVAWPVGLGLGLFVALVGSETLAARRPGPALPFFWMLVTSLTAGALVLSHSASLGQLAGAVAAGLGPLWVIALRERRLGLAPGGALVVAFLHVTLLWAGHFTADLAGTSAVLLGLAPFTPALARLGPLATRPRLGDALALALALALVAVAYWLEWPQPNPYAGYGY